MSEDLELQEGFNAADEVQVKKRKRKVDRQEEQNRDDLGVVLSTLQGRRYLWRLMGECGVYALGFHHEDTHTTALDSGRRSVGLNLTTEITTHFPDAYLQMQAEAYEAAKKEKANG